MWALEPARNTHSLLKADPLWVPTAQLGYWSYLHFLDPRETFGNLKGCGHPCTCQPPPNSKERHATQSCDCNWTNDLGQCSVSMSFTGDRNSQNSPRIFVTATVVSCVHKTVHRLWFNSPISGRIFIRHATEQRTESAVWIAGKVSSRVLETGFCR